jgi:hypothetical protein
MLSRSPSPTLFVAALLVAGAAAAQIAALPSLSPEAAGFSAARLERLELTMQEKVDSGELAGQAQTLMATRFWNRRRMRRRWAS